MSEESPEQPAERLAQAIEAAFIGERPSSVGGGTINVAEALDQIVHCLVIETDQGFTVGNITDALEAIARSISEGLGNNSISGSLNNLSVTDLSGVEQQLSLVAQALEGVADAMDRVAQALERGRG